MSTYSYSALSLVFLVPALGGLLFGYDIGATSFAISMITASSSKAAGEVSYQLDGGTSWWDIPSSYPSLEEGLIVSAVCLGALLGSAIAFRFGDDWGRRSELRVAAVLYLCGALFNALSGTAFASAAAVPRQAALASLLLGRWTYGTGVGFAMHGAPTYMAEMTPPSVRGAVVTAKEAFIVLGMIMGYVAGFAVSGDGRRWYVPYAGSVLISLPMLASTYVIPRSARWLLLRGKIDEAYQSLRFVYKDEEALRKEFDTMSRQLQDRNSKRPARPDYNDRPSRSVFSLALKRAFVTGIGLIVFQQITGEPSVMTYVTIIFHEAGMGGESSIFVSVFMFFSALATVATVDRYGRKRLLLVGCSMMFVALVVLTVCFRGQAMAFEETESEETFSIRKLVILIAMFIYIGGYEVGFGPINWLVLSEVFPLDVRGQAVAVGVQVNFVLNFLVQLVQPTIQEVFGLSNTFGLFALFSAASLFFVEFFVVETKGLSLEEIELHFGNIEEIRADSAEAIESDMLLSELS